MHVSHSKAQRLFTHSSVQNTQSKQCMCVFLCQKMIKRAEEGITLLHLFETNFCQSHPLVLQVGKDMSN